MSHQPAYSSWSTDIDKLMIWRSNAWVTHDSKHSKLDLRIHGDQLLITAESKVLETLNMQCKIKGVYKEDVIILIINDSFQNIRKLKFQVKVNPTHCFQILGEHFPVLHHNSKNNESNSVRYRNVNDVLKAALVSEDITRKGLEIPSDFNNFVKLCLLDPTFPHFVQETKNVLQGASLI